MSKSKGDFLRLHSLQEKHYDPLDYRYLCLTAHYRKQLSYNKKAIEGAHQAYESLKKKIVELQKEATTGGDLRNITENTTFQQHFLAAINDDLNIPEALAVLWNMLKHKNLSAKEKLDLAYHFDRVLGLRLADIREAKVTVPEEVMKLVQEREEARKQKNFKRSDELREQIKKMGFVVADTPTGPVVTNVPK